MIQIQSLMDFKNLGSKMQIANGYKKNGILSIDTHQLKMNTFSNYVILIHSNHSASKFYQIN